MSAEEKDLLQIFGDDVASLYQQELAFPKQTLWDDFFVLLVGGAKIVQVVFEEKDMLLVICKFSVSLSG